MILKIQELDLIQIFAKTPKPSASVGKGELDQAVPTKMTDLECCN
jgi:hypothetical protein